VLDLEVSIESDFADLFDVKAHRRIRRGSIHSVWDQENGQLTNRYANGAFERSLVLEITKKRFSTRVRQRRDPFPHRTRPGPFVALLPAVDAGDQPHAAKGDPPLSSAA